MTRSIMFNALVALGLVSALIASDPYSPPSPIQVTGMMAPAVEECDVEIPHSFPIPGSIYDWCATNMALVLERYQGCKGCCDLVVPGPGNGACHSQCSSQAAYAIRIVFLIFGDDGTCEEDALELMLEGEPDLDITVPEILSMRP